MGRKQNGWFLFVSGYAYASVRVVACALRLDIVLEELVSKLEVGLPSVHPR